MTSAELRDVATEIFEWIDRVPDRVAVVVGDDVVRYHELGTASAALAAELRAAAVQPGDLVLLAVRQSPLTAIGMLAALRLGAAWCVLPPDVIGGSRTLLGDLPSGAVVVDAGEGEASRVRDLMAERAGGPLPVVAVDSERIRSGRDQGGAEPDVCRVPDGLPAYLISTSGTTGEPKAIVLSRAVLTSLLAAFGDRSGLRVHCPLRFTSDGMIALLFASLSTGGTAVFVGQRDIGDASAAADLIHHWEVELVTSTPSFYRLLLPHLDGVDRHLRAVVLGGEPLHLGLVEQHRRRLPRVELSNEYGPAETGTAVARYLVPDPAVPANSGPATPIPFGRTLPGVRAYLLDGRLSPVPSGQVGELYLGGDQVTDGYLKRPVRTAERFVADPFTNQPGARMYRTGDLVHADSGVLEFRGRVDSQVKIRGRLVDLQLVEGVLESHHGVRQAVVIAIPDRNGEHSLAAFWTPDRNQHAEPGTRDLISLCVERLGSAAVPERIVRVAEMPFSANAKVDGAALLAMLPPDRSPDPTAEVDTRWTSVEREIAAIWSEVLAHDDFDRTDSFFDVGGSSRRVVDLHLRLERRWPGAIRVGQLFELSTVRAQAGQVEGTGRTPVRSEPRGVDV